MLVCFFWQFSDEWLWGGYRLLYSLNLGEFNAFQQAEKDQQIGK